MKKLLQFIALAVVVLLAGQPAMAGLNCGMGATNMPCAPGCQMAMSDMGMDCPMPAQMAGPGCVQDCCHQGLPAVVARVAPDTRLRLGAAQTIAVLPAMHWVEEAAYVASPPGSTDAAGPPRYILIQVFRI